MNRKPWIIGSLALIIMLSMGIYFNTNSIKLDKPTAASIPVTLLATDEPSVSIKPITVTAYPSPASISVVYNRNVFINNGWRIFKNVNDQMKLYKLKSDGSGLTKIVDETVALFLVDGDTLYYTLEQNRILYRISITDTQPAVKLSNSPLLQFALLQDTVYSLQENDNQLYTMNTSGKDLTKISDETMAEFRINGDWIYYTQDSEQSWLYKMKLSGTDVTQVKKVTVSALMFQGDYLYYWNENDLCQLDLIKQTTRIIAKGDIPIYDVSPEWIIYRGVDIDGTIWKVKPDGSERTEITKYSPYDTIELIEDSVYFDSEFRDPYLYKYDLQTQDKKLLARHLATNIQTIKDDMFYTNYPNLGLFKMNISTQKEVTLTKDEMDNYVISGEWIYYQNLSDDNHLYRIKLDGTNRTQLSKMKITSFRVTADKVYYLADGLPGLYSEELDGYALTKLIDNDIEWFSVSADHIIFSVDHIIHSSELDGSQFKKIGKGYDATLSGTDLYFTDTSTNNMSIKRIHQDGTGLSTVVKDLFTDTFIVDNGYIYCSKQDYNLYKIKIDGTEEIKLSTIENFGDIIRQVDSDWVYYESYGESNDTFTSMFRVKQDGTDRQELPSGYIRGSEIKANTLLYSEDLKTNGIMKTDLSGTEAQLIIKPDMPE